MTTLELTKKAEAYVAAREAPGRAQLAPEAPDIGAEPLREPASPAAGEASIPEGTIFLQVDTSDRVKLATSIELLINALDALDTDPDLEDGADGEPSLGGWVAGWHWNGAAGKLEHDLEADNADDEPSLGAPEGGPWHSQASWAKGSPSGREVDADFEPSIGSDEPESDGNGCGTVDDEDDGTGEPSLGWSNSIGQSGVGLVGWAGVDTGDCDGGLDFRRDGYAEGERLLREKVGKLDASAPDVVVMQFPYR